MQGKKITDTFDFTGDYTLIKFDDGTVSLVKVINAELAEDEVKELAELLGAVEKPEKKEEAKSTKKGKAAPKKSTSKEVTYEDLQGMDHDDLSKLVKSKKLDVDPDDFDEDEEKEMKDFVDEVAEELDIKVPEEDKGTKDDDYTWEDLEKMDFEELGDLVEEEDLDEDVDMDDFDEDEDEDEEKLRKAIAESMEIPVPKKKKKK